MLLVSRLLRVYLLRRLLGGGRHHRGYGSGRRRRGRAGFLGPFPTYSTRTRRGSRVTVTGCCLPIPLALGLSLALAARLLVRR
jgi:hypothetical protein